MNKPLELLQQWVDAGWLRHLDRALARWVAELDPQARPELLMATALLAHLEGRGHTCLPLAHLLQAPIEPLAWPVRAVQGERGVLALRWRRDEVAPSRGRERAGAGRRRGVVRGTLSGVLDRW